MASAQSFLDPGTSPEEQREFYVLTDKWKAEAWRRKVVRDKALQTVQKEKRS